MLSPSGVYLRKNAKRKYDAILKSACRLFLKHGYTRTSMDAIAADAGVSKQTVYSYFTNKDILFCQMIEAECARHDPPEHLLEEGALEPKEALYRIGRGYLDTLLGHRGVAIHRLVIAEAPRHPRIAELFFESGPSRIRRNVTVHLKRQVQKGFLVINDFDRAADMFSSLLKMRYQQRMMLRLKPAPTRKELDAHVREMVEALYKIYGAAQASAAIPQPGKAATHRAGG